MLTSGSFSTGNIVMRLHQQLITLRPNITRLTLAAGLGRHWQQSCCRALSLRAKTMQKWRNIQWSKFSFAISLPYHIITPKIWLPFFPPLETRQLRRLWKSLLTRFISLSEDFFWGVAGLKSSTPLGCVCVRVCVVLWVRLCVCVCVYWHVCKTACT